MALAVSRVWTTDLEAGVWHEVVDPAKPGIIVGFVFVPPKGETDVRGVDGKKLPRDSAELAGRLYDAVAAYKAAGQPIGGSNG